MAWQPNPLMAGFDQGGDGTDAWNKLTPDDARGPLTVDPQGAALARQFYAIRDSIAGEQAPIWNQNNPVGTETLQSVGMPEPTTYAGPVGQFIDPATGRMTTQGMARMDNPAMGFDTGGIGGMAGHFTAYHGSPHSFDAFDLSKIGTGEGAQAYGHGMYLADAEGVARGYRDALSKGPITDPVSGRVYQHSDPYYDDAVKMYGSPGHMYEVQVNADPAHFLDWERPLSEQSQHVQDVFGENGAMPEVGKYFAQNPRLASNGAAIEDTLKMMGHTSASAAQALSDAGIPGIRYLDAGSRNASGWHITPPDQTVSGKWMVKSNDYNSQGIHFDNEADAQAALADKIGGQTRNSVVFNPANMEIIRKYGLAWLLGGGAAGAAATQGTPQQ